jgi:uncharacterized protein (TIGR01777 family)
MPRFVARSPMPVDAGELSAWHLRPGALERLLPPWQSVRVVQRAPVEEGARVVLRMGPGPFGVRWVAQHRNVEPGRQFEDVQLSGPFARWVHSHRFLSAARGSLLEDEIDYALPAGGLGRALGAGPVRALLERLFRFRHARTRGDLERHAAFADRARLCVAVTGATGLVGTALRAYLQGAGHEALRITRSPDPGAGDVGWSPAQGRLDAAALDGVDAVVHLAGENLFGLRWSERKKRAIRESRVAGTRLLCEALAGLEPRPRVLVSASAIGFYGDRGEERLGEASGPGAGFLAEVCRDWEAATAPAEKAGIRVVHLRIGVVLSAAGGALATLLPAFRMGLGGRLGSGEQGFSWISLDDLLAAIELCLHRDDLSGALNATAPSPVSNAEFTRAVGRVLRRPTRLPAPASLLKGLLGEMAEEMLLASAYVLPARLTEAGFGFRHRDVEAALRFELGRLEGEGPRFELHPG